MTGVEAVSAVTLSAAAPPGANAAESHAAPPGTSFGAMIGEGLHRLEERLTTADTLVRAFTIDGSIPVHQVTIALEEARMALELALQVRARVVEAYREIMNMQL